MGAHSVEVISSERSLKTSFHAVEMFICLFSEGFIIIVQLLEK